MSSFFRILKSAIVWVKLISIVLSYNDPKVFAEIISIAQSPRSNPESYDKLFALKSDKDIDDTPNVVTRISYLNEQWIDASEQLTAIDLQNSYVIDQTRFVEKYPTRCLASTIPKNPKDVEPSFVIVTENSDYRVNATASLSEILEAGFKPGKPTLIATHGNMQRYPHTDWLRQLRSLFKDHSLLSHQNLIFMDWGKGSRGLYPVTAARAGVIGSFLAVFVERLTNLGSDPKKVHLIGHSLGGQVVGFAGKRIRPKVGRITSLDPTSLCFGAFNPQDDRISADDAIEVDVFHYDDGFLSSPGKLGLIDVYVNGGYSQPGCSGALNSIGKRILAVLLGTKPPPPSENHRRAVQIVTVPLSLTRHCQMIAYECESWDAFQAGECGYCDQSNNQCFQMDFNFQYNDRPEPKPIREGKALSVYIATGEHHPFCMHHFQIKITTTKPYQVDNVLGLNGLFGAQQFYLKLIDEHDEISKLTVSHQKEPDVYTHLLLSDRKARRYTKVYLDMRNQKNFPIKKVEINYMSDIDPAARQRLSSRFCAVEKSDKTEIQVENTSDPLWVLLEEC